MKHSFDHERLDCYRLAIEVNRWFSRAGFPRGRSHLRDQGLRASDSVVCNIAELDSAGFADCSVDGGSRSNGAVGSVATSPNCGA